MKWNDNTVDFDFKVDLSISTRKGKSRTTKLWYKTKDGVYMRTGSIIFIQLYLFSIWIKFEIH